MPLGSHIHVPLIINALNLLLPWDRRSVQNVKVKRSVRNRGVGPRVR